MWCFNLVHNVQWRSNTMQNEITELRNQIRTLKRKWHNIMDMEFLQDFFMWGTILNFGVLLFSFTVYTCGRNRLQRIHATLYGLTPEQVGPIIYRTFALYKSLTVIFFLVPWIALRIISWPRGQCNALPEAGDRIRTDDIHVGNVIVCRWVRC